MTIDELVKMRTEAEAKILLILRNIEVETGATIDSVLVRKSHALGADERVTSIRIEVKLP